MNKEDSEIEEIDENKNWVRNFSVSILLHLLFIAILIFIYGLRDNKSRVNSLFFTIDTKEFLTQQTDLVEDQKDNFNNQEQVLPDGTTSGTFEELKAISFSNIVVDTTNLDQLYTESSLNVSIKYPKGWTFIDQNKKKKLDSVTFWANDGTYNPPPYIHLEVVDSDFFIENRFSYKLELGKNQAYYNEPEEMQGYMTQIVYIRTGEDEDFRLKLMMKGKSEFYSFQPKFWAILKSFQFGSSFF